MGVIKLDYEEKFANVYLIDGNVATVNLKPTLKVYGENLVNFDGKEFRIWNPRRSKLAAAILNGLSNFPFNNNSKVLYLGASSGTTPSHISDVIINGLVYCVEFSPRMMRDLVKLTDLRGNMIPILDDATKPINYLHLMEKVDVIYSDVAQARQTELFMDNMRFFLKNDGVGIIMLKSRSIDVTENPKKIFKNEEAKLKANGFHILEKISLEPYEKDHLAIVCEFGF